VRNAVKDFNPFDLSTFHCLDWRAPSGESRAMTSSGDHSILSKALVQARIDLCKATEKQAVTRATAERMDAEVRRLSATLDSLTASLANFGEGKAGDAKRGAAEEAAGSLARTIGAARAAAVDLETATAEVDSLTNAADRALEELIVASSAK
jgi:hypothetical protein